MREKYSFVYAYTEWKTTYHHVVQSKSQSTQIFQRKDWFYTYTFIEKTMEGQTI